MKFKLIFVLLNITLLLLLGIIVVLPLLMGGVPFAAFFWQQNWLFTLVWTVIFLFFNYFYFSNRKLFYLLEREDWPALVHYLEDRVIQKGRYSKRLVRLLANSYLILSDSASVMNLENKTAIARPALVDENALIFGTARILGKDISGAIRFFQSRKGRANAKIREWISWYCGFSLLLDSQFNEAAEVFLPLARFSKDAVITALSSYFLSQSIARFLPESGPALEAAAAGAERVKKALPRLSDWNKEVSRLSTEIHAAALSKYMEETGQWVFSHG